MSRICLYFKMKMRLQFSLRMICMKFLIFFEKYSLIRVRDTWMVIHYETLLRFCLQNKWKKKAEPNFFLHLSILKSFKNNCMYQYLADNKILPYLSLNQNLQKVSWISRFPMLKIVQSKSWIVRSTTYVDRFQFRH